MLIGGLCAILMQSLHPLAMAGVADHSNFRDDPWGRLQRTAGFLAATTFGPAEGAERAIAVVRQVHERVVGVAGDGRPYAANDPHLLRWVHIGEVDSFLRAYRRYGATTLSNRQADDYVRDMARIATELGADTPPYSVAELRAQIAGYRAELRGTPAAREAARFLIVDPPLPIAARPPYAMLAAAAVSLLPLWARVPLRLPVLPVTERLLVRPGGQLVIHAIRWATQPTTPGNATSQP